MSAEDKDKFERQRIYGSSKIKTKGPNEVYFSKRSNTDEFKAMIVRFATAEQSNSGVGVYDQGRFEA